MNEPNAEAANGSPDNKQMYLAPYEFWNYGLGKPYALPVIKGKILYITAVAEHPEPIKNPAKKRADDDPDGSARWLPTLWMQAPGQYELSFLPFVTAFSLKRELNPATLSGNLIESLEQLIISNDFLQQRWAKFVTNVRFRLSFPVHPKALDRKNTGLPDQPQWEPDADVAKHPAIENMTVVAVIDAGIPFAHRNFRNAGGDKTRFEFCWLQDAPIDKKRNRRTVAFGREFDRKRINKLIKDHGDDEDYLYAVSGASADLSFSGSPVNRRNSHGAHVLDLASGFAEGRDQHFGSGKPKDRSDLIRLICVQLPESLTVDTSGFGRDMYILSAFHYIFNRADEIKKEYKVTNLRLIVNFSYGFTAGPHDAGSVVEAAVDEMVYKRRGMGQPTAVVVPSGNSFVDRTHGLIRDRDFGGNRKATVQWRMQPNDRTPSYLELWFPHGFNSSKYAVSLTDPAGHPRASMTVKEHPSFEGAGDPRNIDKIHDRYNNIVGQLSVDRHRYDNEGNNSRSRWRVLIILAPTEPENPDLPGAEAGLWQITISREVGAPPLGGPIRCWVQRDIEISPFPTGGRQSYLDDPGYRRFDDEGKFNEKDETDAHGEPVSYVQRLGSLSGLATGHTFLTVAGFRTTARNGGQVNCPVASVYSSAGLPPCPPAKSAGEGAGEVETALKENRGDGSDKANGIASVSNEKVDCSSMSDRSTLLLGTVAAGTRSGSSSILQGTSAAAPAVARRLAESFVTKSYADIKNCEPGNYLGLLASMHCDDDIDTTRLGDKRIKPYGQPGIILPK